jgi:hypothetical protein
VTGLCRLGCSGRPRISEELVHRIRFQENRGSYDAAWQDLWAKRLTLNADQVPVLKKNLTQIILASACNGRRDVEQLKDIALRCVSVRSRASL